MRPPAWQRDEIIIALDLYHRLEPHEMDNNHPEVIAVSELLNKLPIHKDKKDNQKFRNTNGIGLKLSNFKAIDPDYGGKGMERYSKLDKDIFYEFIGRSDQLHRLAEQIKQTVTSEKLVNSLQKIEDEDEIITPVKEGKVIYKLHKYRERNTKINKKKKAKYLKKFGRLDCEVCGFDFQDYYGDLGGGFIECHHRIPLSELDGETETALDDLALVCPNCHRMLHRDLNTLSIEKLSKLIKTNK